MKMNTDDCEYGFCYIVGFSEAYDRIHIPLSALICIFGSLSNVVNVIVLTRKNMRTPINIFLTGLSIAQFLLGTNYLCLLVFEYLRSICFEFSLSYTAASYRLINVNVNVVFHTVAFSHTIAVAVFRLCALKWPLRASSLIFSNKRAVICSVFVWIFIPILCIPVYMTSYVAKVPNAGVCELQETYDLLYVEDEWLLSTVFWMFGVVLKLFPSVLLVFLLSALIRSLQDVDHRRQGTLRRKISILRGSQNNRPKTTHTLLAILILSFIVEFPHGILNLCTAINGERFGVRVYDQLGSFMEMLTLLYSSISFVLYCVTSNDFLKTFKLLFLKPRNKDLEGSSLRPQSRSLSANQNLHIRPAETIVLMTDGQLRQSLVLSRSM